MKELVKSGDLGVDLATAFDASPNPYMLVTPDLRYAGVNEAYLAALDTTREAIIGKLASDSGARGSVARSWPVMRRSLISSSSLGEELQQSLAETQAPVHPARLALAANGLCRSSNLACKHGDEK